MGTTREQRLRREQFRAEAEQRVWRDFHAKLEAMETLEDALKLFSESPRPDAPGRSFYSNLGFFLRTFAPPFGSNRTERAVYLKFVRGLDRQGLLKPGALSVIEAAFAEAEQDGQYR